MTSLRNLTLFTAAILFHPNASALDFAIEDINETARSLKIMSKVRYWEDIRFYGTKFREGIDENPDYKESGIVATSTDLANWFHIDDEYYPFKSRIDPATDKVRVTLEFEVYHHNDYSLNRAMDVDLLFFNQDSKKYFARLPVGSIKASEQVHYYKSYTYKASVDPNKWHEVWAKADHIVLFVAESPLSDEQLAARKEWEAEKAERKLVEKAGYEAGKKFRRGKTKRPSTQYLTRIAKVKAKQAGYIDEDESVFVSGFERAF